MINRKVLWKESQESILQSTMHSDGLFLIRCCGPLSLISRVFFPPVVMNHQHQQQMAPSTLSPQNHPAQNPPAGLMTVPNALTTQQQQQQKLRLQRIQMERERIRMRQEELMRQVRSSGIPVGVRACWCQSYWVGRC